MKANTFSTVITESTAVKTNLENNRDEMSPLWQSVLVGGVPGILIGAGALKGAEAVADSIRTNRIEEGSEGSVEEAPVEIHEAYSVSDDMSFSEAFAAARAEVGAGGAFVWHGNVYGTYRADDPEWMEMTAEDRAAHSQDILAQVHARPYTPTVDEPEIVPVPETSSGSYDAPAVEEADDADDIDVHILGVGELPTPYGMVQAGVGTVDDHQAVFVDTDGDDMVDTVMIDINDNTHLDRGEIFDMTGAEIPMDELRESVEPMDTSVMDAADDSQDLDYLSEGSCIV